MILALCVFELHRKRGNSSDSCHKSFSVCTTGKLIEHEYFTRYLTFIFLKSISTST